MLTFALALAAAAPSLDTHDDANFALTTCQFAVMRRHSARRATPDDFAAALAGACHAEKARVRGLLIAVAVARGERRDAATADTDAFLASERARMVENYARFQAFDASAYSQ